MLSMARLLRPKSLVELLAKGRERERGAMIMASDGDGTLWHGDVGEELFEAAIGARLLKGPALARLLHEASEHDVVIDAGIAGDASRVGEALLLAHRAGHYPNAAAFAMMAWAFAGFTEDELDALCERVLDDGKFASRLRPELLPMRKWAQRAEVPLWLVSASPLAIVRAAGRRMGIAAEHVVAMEPLVVGAVLQPELGPEPTYRDGKLARLRLLTDARLLAGFGDSYWDLALIEAARIGVAVAPNDRLRRRMAELDDGYLLEAKPLPAARSEASPPR